MNPVLTGVDFSVTGSVNVQNRLDKEGNVKTFVMIRYSGAVKNAASFGIGHGSWIEVLQIDSNLIGSLTGGLVGALANPTITGSW